MERPAKRQSGAPLTPSRRAAQRVRQQQRRMRLLLGTIVVVVVAIVAVLVVVSQTSQSSTSKVRGVATPSALNPGSNLLAVGSRAPDFALTSVNGTHYKLSSMRGSTVFLEYFAVWCPVCHAEAPTIDQLNTDFSPKGVKVLGILANPFGPNYDTSNRTDPTPAQKQDLLAYQKTYGVKFPLLIDPTFANVNAMGANSYPTLYVIDGAGIVRYANSGGIGYQELADALNKAATRA
jgi:peroxiredoxin